MRICLILPYFSSTSLNFTYIEQSFQNETFHIYRENSYKPKNHILTSSVFLSTIFIPAMHKNKNTTFEIQSILTADFHTKPTMYLVKEGRAATTKQANISYLLRIRLARGITFDTAYRKCIMHDKYSDEIGYFFSIQIRAN